MGRMPPTSPLSLLKRDGERKRDTRRKRDFNMNFAPFNVRVFSFSFDFSFLLALPPSSPALCFRWSKCKHGNYGLCES